MTTLNNLTIPDREVSLEEIKALLGFSREASVYRWLRQRKITRLKHGGWSYQQIQAALAGQGVKQ